MAAWRRAIELAIGEEELAALGAIVRSRTEPASRVERARMLLAYRDEPSFFKVGRAVGAHHQTVQRCVERALVYGPMAALDDRPRPGKGATITAEAKAWVVDLACRKAKELGYPHELWTTRLLARHAREHGPAQGHTCLAKLAQGTLCNILNEQEIKPHKVRYYLERRDPEFKQKMAEVLCVYREVKLIKETAAAAKQQPSDAVAIVSYDEKPGIQAIATTAPDLPPQPGGHATFARDHEYKRLGTVSLLAGIDLLTGQVHALVKDRHRSREFVEFLKLLDAAYPTHTAIKLILDNHSAHISKKPKLGSQSSLPVASNSPLRPSTAPGSILSRASSPSLPARCCAISASLPNRNSRTVSWPPWITSIATPSSILGPISSTRPPDMIRISKSMN
jgi:hypothetical protein